MTLKEWPIRRCVVCNKDTPRLAHFQRKTCSEKCKGIFTGRKLGLGNRVGIRNKNLRERMKNEKNPMWTGNNVGYNGVHHWVRSRLPKPKMCPKCNLRPAYDLANKGKYIRDLAQWEWLCRRCHMYSDGRIKKLRASFEEAHGKILEFRGRKMLAYQWAKELKLPDNIIHNRLFQGWSVDRTLSTPKYERGKYPRS